VEAEGEVVLLMVVEVEVVVTCPPFIVAIVAVAVSAVPVSKGSVCAQGSTRRTHAGRVRYR
jgi:hypothetical protein